MNRTNQVLLLAALVFCASCAREEPSTPKQAAQSPSPNSTIRVEATKVVSQTLAITLRLPGELEPYEVVSVYPKVTGFVKWIGVDRGSRVKEGELVARLEAPELVSHRAEATAKLLSAEAQLEAARAKLAADESTYQRLKNASATPGVVAGNDVQIAQKAAEAGQAQAKALENNVAAARQALQAIADTEDYLRVKAPFDGVVTARNVHTGALVGPAGAPGVAVPMLRIQSLAMLRLVVPVPELYVAGVSEGAKVEFTVPAFPGRTFAGTNARISHEVDVKTRAMPVELDVLNAAGLLAPGTYAEVQWPVRRKYPTLFVPVSCVATTLERVFVVRIQNGKAVWVDVKTGANSGKLIEVFGDLNEGDFVAVRGTDELRPGTPMKPHLSPST